jgi:hypothetical protein
MTNVFHAALYEVWVHDPPGQLRFFEPGNGRVPALVLESIKVDPQYQRQGRCRSFIQSLLRMPGYDLVIVEGAGNNHLADALRRWGWNEVPDVKDFWAKVKP